MSAAALCARCVLDATVPGVTFDGRGVCSHCRVHDELECRHPLGAEGERRLRALAAELRAAGSGKRYDCIVGLSGGRDTCYCLHVAASLGLRPLAVHFDNGWDSAAAKGNIERICSKLGVDLHVVVADWDESRELTNCSLRASVPYIDVTDDVGIASALYRTAAEEGIRHILLSHSFRTEGVNPLKWNYVDARYIRALIARFCRVELKRFRNVDVHHILYWTLVKGIKVANITNLYDDRGPEVEDVLRKEYGWVDTGGHHFDNEIFGLQSWWARRKFGIDFRVIEFAALVRSGTMTREEALRRLQTPPPHENQAAVDYALKKQGVSAEEFAALLAAPPRSFEDYPTYYPLLRMLERPFRLMCRLGIFPSQAYEKFFAV